MALGRRRKRREKSTASLCLLGQGEVKSTASKPKSQLSYHGNRRRERPVKPDAPIKLYWSIVTMEHSHKHT